MAPTISELTGDSIYLFMDLKTPILLVVAIITVLGQFFLMGMLTWAANEENKKGDFSNGFGPSCEAAGVAPTCESIQHMTNLGSFAIVLITLLTQVPDVIRGCRLLKRCKPAPGITMIITAIVGITVNIIYVNATLETDSQGILNSVVILMVNQFDELVYNFVWTCVPDWVAEQKQRLDAEAGETK